MTLYHRTAPFSTESGGAWLRSTHAPKLEMGAVVGDTLWRQITDNNRQILRHPRRAFSFTADTLREAERRGCRWVVVTDEHGKQYRAPLGAFWRAPAFELNRGYGLQVALPLDAWDDPTKPKPVQPALFEVEP